MKWVSNTEKHLYIFINRVYICHTFVDNCVLYLYTYMFGYAWNLLQVWVKTFIGIITINYAQAYLPQPITSWCFLFMSWKELKHLHMQNVTYPYIDTYNSLTVFRYIRCTVYIIIYNIYIFIRVLFDGLWFVIHVWLLSFQD